MHLISCVPMLSIPLSSLAPDLYQAGKDAVDGLVKGINDKISAAVAKSKELASGVKNAVTNFLTSARHLV